MDETWNKPNIEDLGDVKDLVKGIGGGGGKRAWW